MKKTLAMMTVLLLAGTLLSGCGKKAVEETAAVPADTQGTTQAETETVAAAADTGGEKVKIEFWYAWGDKIGETNEERPDGLTSPRIRLRWWHPIREAMTMCSPRHRLLLQQGRHQPLR